MKIFFSKMKLSIILLSLSALLFYGCDINNNNSDISKDNSTDISTDESVEISDNSKPSDNVTEPREDATLEEAEQSTLQTDKNEYDHDDSIEITIKCPFEDDFITYGDYIYIQYYDAEKEEWTNSSTAEDFIYKDIAAEGMGEVKYKFDIAGRAETDAEKFRLSTSVKINSFEVELISNEFKINP